MSFLHHVLPSLPPPIHAKIKKGMFKTDLTHTKNVTIDDFIAMGGYGKVFKGTFRASEDDDPVEVAIKVIENFYDEKNSRRTRVAREISILSRMHHYPEFIDLIQVYRAPREVHEDGATEEEDTREPLYIVMPFVPTTAFKVARDLSLRASEEYVEVLVKLIMTQILSGLQKMHERKIYHRDLSSSNILVDVDSNFAYISDFGLSRSVQDNTLLTPLVVTLPYRAPELLLDPRATSYDPSHLDLWSAGMILWELLSGEAINAADEIKQAIAITTTLFGGKLDYEFWERLNPRGTEKARELFRKNESRLVANAHNTKLPEPILKASTQCRDVLFKLLSQKPEDRGSAKDILSMPWFEDEFVESALAELQSPEFESASTYPFDHDIEKDVVASAELFDVLAPRLSASEAIRTTISHTQTEKFVAPQTQA